ncbi:imidazole glycerol phosphate synthase subunit HisH (plasmid) [Pseudohalocynthiibacter aestuariivivens]|uniref:Imidazole glycerol phosphate synthase subunit HisH n=1 Tax=Roseovarius pelagicus TaxID=2980108 RepID=A0ABY6D675_9RHOB|nr:MULTISPECIES: imidazole glycerol phosphate synthase subunit HisH [Rhodobacterales]QIE47921.1 imidazole glycerol phosphate synthase subunit HisH [Pseudohalocynthiibacter aestuariivivens]UXX81414.1 imidazole glycerol phosphate synthase subunit HisH [Roseovarius pelagicus]
MQSPSCVVIDYGIGNVFSVMQALRQLGTNVELSADRDIILAADRVILPGVGAFGKAVDTLRDMGLDNIVREFIATERPFLGICVGMQVLMERGQEYGTHEGLGFFKGEVTRIDLADETGEKLRVPLIGWNTPVPTTEDRWQGTPFASTPPQTDYYFVHSYSVDASDPADVAATVPVGTGHVTAAIQRDNITGVQFHPERSANGGQAFLAGFLAL